MRWPSDFAGKHEKNTQWLNFNRQAIKDLLKTEVPMVNIKFEISKHGFTLKDTLVLEDDHNLTLQEIEAMKQQRVDNWYLALTEIPNEEPVQE